MDTIVIVERETGIKVTPDTPLDALGLDSLEFLDLLLTLDVPVEKSMDLHTVGDLIREIA